MTKIIKWLIFVVVGGVVLSFIVSLFFALKFTSDFKGILENLAVDFDSCEALGYPVLESYPRKCRTPNEEMFIEDIGNEIEKFSEIRISTPRPNGKVESPLSIEGEARGTWFFEGDFPVKMLDAGGKKLGEGYVSAEGEWMTEEFVAFKGTLEFENSQTFKGKLILEKDNPSGLSENADQLEVPIKFNIEIKSSDSGTGSEDLENLELPFDLNN